MRPSTSRIRRIRFVLSYGVLPALMVLSAAGFSTDRVRGDEAVAVGSYTVCDLKRMSACELERLFASVDAGPMPSGWMPGELLILTDFPLPRTSEALSRHGWKGKHVCPDGSFINQFRYHQRFPSKAVIEPSFYDGKPAIVMAYPPNTFYFRNIRDEFRMVAPGLYLGRIYNTAKCPRLLGWMYLRQSDECGN